MSEDVVRLERNGLAVDVSPLGGAVLAAHWHGVPLLAPASSPGLASQVLGAEACFPLVPFGNRIEGSAFRFGGRRYGLLQNTADPLVLHGDAWLRRWSILRRDHREITLRYDHQASDASPYAYEAVQTIAAGDGTLSLSLAVVNRAAQTLPYGLGFHPYFPRTPRARLFTRATGYWTERENHLPGHPGVIPPDLDFAAGAPLPARWLNNAFDGWDGQARIALPETGLVLRLEADRNFRFFVLYAPSPDAGFFCLEPMTHRPNAHNGPQDGGLVPLAPGERLSGRVILRPARLEEPPHR